MILSGLMVLLVLVLILIGAIVYQLYYKMACKFLKTERLRMVAVLILFVIFIAMLFTALYIVFLALLVGSIFACVLSIIYQSVEVMNK